MESRRAVTWVHAYTADPQKNTRATEARVTSRTAAGKIQRRPYNSTGKGPGEAVTPISAQGLPAADRDRRPSAVRHCKCGSSAVLLALPRESQNPRGVLGTPTTRMMRKPISWD